MNLQPYFPVAIIVKIPFHLSKQSYDQDLTYIHWEE